MKLVIHYRFGDQTGRAEMSGVDLSAAELADKLTKGRQQDQAISFQAGTSFIVPAHNIELMELKADD